MVDPSKPRKEGIRCKGKLNKGPKKGNPCNGLILGKDDLSVACHNCGESHHILALLDEAVKRDYLNRERVLEALSSLSQEGRRRMSEKIVRYKCTICSQEYESEKDAVNCEAKNMEEVVYRKGDTAKVEVPGYGGWYTKPVIIEDVTTEPITHKVRYWFSAHEGHVYATLSRDGKLVQIKYQNKL